MTRIERLAHNEQRRVIDDLEARRRQLQEARQQPIFTRAARRLGEVWGDLRGTNGTQMEIERFRELHPPRGVIADPCREPVSFALSDVPLPR